MRSEDFPLQVEIVAANLRANRAIVSDLRMSAGAVPVSTTKPDVKVDQDANSIRYEILAPAEASADLITQSIDGYFETEDPPDARYEITITSATGVIARAAIRVPSINPGVAELAFHLR